MSTYLLYLDFSVVFIMNVCFATVMIFSTKICGQPCQMPDVVYK